jgi:hypothetical protein
LLDTCLAIREQWGPRQEEQRARIYFSGLRASIYAEVKLRITDGAEQREWQAWVAFTPACIRRPLLGFGGFLQFFTAAFYGDREQVELTTNSFYRGT